VHIIDEGTDTGEILGSRVVNWDSVRSVRELRDAVDRAQLALPGEVVSYVVDTGTLPPLHPQDRDVGRQYFQLHSALIERLKASWLTADGRPRNYFRTRTTQPA
jgi:hypothetical protein